MGERQQAAPALRRKTVGKTLRVGRTLSRSRKLIDHRALWIMALPAILYFALFKYIPTAGVVIAFQRFSPFRGFFESPWVGFRYFEQFVSSVFFGRVLRNTIMIGLFNLVFAFPVPIVLAILLNNLRTGPYKKVTQTITLLPHFVSFVVVAGIAVNFLSPSTGVINGMLGWFGVEPIFFMQQPGYFWFIYTAIRIFKSSGFEAIVYLAALSAIDPALYEAAEVDGAGKLTQLFRITIPSILSTIVIMFLVKVGNLITISFEEVLLLQNDVILETAEVISTFVYRRGLISADYSYATAVGVLETVVALALVIGSNAIARRVRSESSLW